MLAMIGVGFLYRQTKLIPNYRFVFLHFSHSKEVKDEHISLIQCECLT